MLAIDSPPLWIPPRPAIVRPEVLKPSKEAIAWFTPVFPNSKKPFTVTYIGATGSTANATNYTHTGVAIPRAGLVVAAIGRYQSASARITAVTMNGNAATRAAGATANSTGGMCYLWQYRLLAAATVVVVTTAGGGALAECVMFWLIENNLSDTASATQNSSSVAGTGSSRASAVNMTAGQIAIFLGFSSANTVTFSAATAGSGTLTYDYKYASAKYLAAGAETPHTETISFGGANNNAVAGAVWS